MAGMAYKIDWAHLISWQLLPIRMNRPIIFMANAVNKIECVTNRDSGTSEARDRGKVT